MGKLFFSHEEREVLSTLTFWNPKRRRSHHILGAAGMGPKE